MTRFVIATLTVMLAIAPAAAKEKAERQHQMDPKAMMEAYQKAAIPGEPHKLFATLEGSWTTHTKSWMEPDKPPVETTGSAEMKMLLGGRFLKQEFTGEMMGQPFKGIGFSGYDNLTKRYVTAWMDNQGTNIFLMEGTASPDGKTITMTGQHAQPDGGKMTHRAVWKLDTDTQHFEMYGKHGDEKEMKVMEITYTRKK